MNSLRCGKQIVRKDVFSIYLTKANLYWFLSLMVVPGNKLSLVLLPSLWSRHISVEPKYLYYHDLSLWLLVLIFHAQINLTVFFHLASSVNNCRDLQFFR